MKLILKDATFFKKCVDAIGALVDEAEFILNDNGLSLKATDPSQISMVDFSIDKKTFEVFDVKEQTKIGIDLDYFGQILGRAKSGDSLELSFDENRTKLNAIFSGSAKRSFEVPLIDVSSGELPSPKIDFDAEVAISSGEVMDGIKDALLISTHITLGVDEEHFFIRANSSKGKLNNQIKLNDKKVVTSFKAKNEARATFPLDYLRDMIKGAASDTPVTIKLKTNAPISISYKIGEASISYFLAPRIESE
jgi:proliferating cell nuclear antigen